MARKPRRTNPYADAETTRALQRAGIAEQVWSEIEVQKVVMAAKTARSKARRLVPDAAKAAGAKSSKPQTTKRSTRTGLA